MRTVAPLIGSGYLVLLPDGAQAVVRHAWDGEPVEVVRTGGGRAVEMFPAEGLVVLRAPSSCGGDCCLTCGDVWKRHGDRTSHCPSCHETFEGGSLWDAHRVQGHDGKFLCRRASAMEFQKVRLRKVVDPIEGLVTVGTWRGPKLEAGAFA
jgi:hypothetical protein